MIRLWDKFKDWLFDMDAMGVGCFVKIIQLIIIMMFIIIGILILT